METAFCSGSDLPSNWPSRGCHRRDLSVSNGTPRPTHEGRPGRAERDFIGTCLRQVPRHCCVRPPDRLSRRSERDSNAEHERERRRVIGGVDAHADTHHAAVLDDRGAPAGDQAVRGLRGGYRELLAWLRSFGEIERIGVESTGSYAAGLTRYLVGEGVPVIEVNQPHAHTRRRRGKTDAIDAELAARHASPTRSRSRRSRPPGIVESIRQLRVARDSAVKSRSAAMLQLGDLDPHRAQRASRAARGTARRSRERPRLCRRLRPDHGRLEDPINAAKLALRSLARRIALSGQRDRRARRAAHAAGRERRAQAPPPCSGSPPDTPDNSCSPPVRTSSGSAARLRSPRFAGPAQSQSPQANVVATA